MGQFYLIDLERSIKYGLTTYWKPGKNGYTNYLSEAGLYTKASTDAIIKDDFDKMTIAISEKMVNNMM